MRNRGKVGLAVIGELIALNRWLKGNSASGARTSMVTDNRVYHWLPIKCESTPRRGCACQKWVYFLGHRNIPRATDVRTSPIKSGRKQAASACYQAICARRRDGTQGSPQAMLPLDV